MRGDTQGAAAVLLVAATLSCGRAPAREPASQPAPVASNQRPPAAAAPAIESVPCRESTTQAELTACWGAESRRAEQAARGAFDRATMLLRDRPDPKAQSALAHAESSWAAYRDAHCAAAAAVYEGGSLGAMQQARCRAALAEERRLVLERFATDLAR